MESVRIIHLFPELLNFYGDGGNVRCLQKRCEWRGISAEVIAVSYGEQLGLHQADIVFLGGGSSREQQLAARQLFSMKAELQSYVEAGGILLAVGGGYPLIGKECLLAGDYAEGLGLVDMISKKAKASAKRLVDNVVLQSELCAMPIVGYEDHLERTYLGQGLDPLGTLISITGHGNNDDDGHEGVLYKNLVGSYLHGPLLAKNPQLADYLLQKVFDVRAARGVESIVLTELDDSVEQAANAYLLKRLRLR